MAQLVIKGDGFCHNCGSAVMPAQRMAVCVKCGRFYNGVKVIDVTGWNDNVK